MGINIQFAARPDIKHINFRKEGEEGAEELAADIKIEGIAEIGSAADLIQSLLGCEELEARRLWVRDGDHVLPAFSGIEKIESWAFYQHGHALHIDRRTFHPKKLKKFTFKPIEDHLVQITFQASINELAPADSSFLTDRLHEPIECSVESIQDDMFNDSQAEPDQEPEPDPVEQTDGLEESEPEPELEECQSCGSKHKHEDLMLCHHCGSTKCADCDMGKDVECGACPEDEDDGLGDFDDEPEEEELA